MGSGRGERSDALTPPSQPGNPSLRKMDPEAWGQLVSANLRPQGGRAHPGLRVALGPPPSILGLASSWRPHWILSLA